MIIVVFAKNSEKNKKYNRQENNETLINKIKEYQMNLSIKLEKDEKYLNQFKSINILLNYLKKTIKLIFIFFFAAVVR